MKFSSDGTNPHIAGLSLSQASVQLLLYGQNIQSRGRRAGHLHFEISNYLILYSVPI